MCMQFKTSFNRNGTNAMKISVLAYTCLFIFVFNPFNADYILMIFSTESSRVNQIICNVCEKSIELACIQSVTMIACFGFPVYK